MFNQAFSCDQNRCNDNHFFEKLMFFVATYVSDIITRIDLDQVLTIHNSWLYELMV